MELRVFVSEDRRTLVHLWEGENADRMTVATREDPDATWGPPIEVKEENPRHAGGKLKHQAAPPTRADLDPTSDRLGTDNYDYEGD